MEGKLTNLVVRVNVRSGVSPSREHKVRPDGRGILEQSQTHTEDEEENIEGLYIRPINPPRDGTFDSLLFLNQLALI